MKEIKGMALDPHYLGSNFDSSVDLLFDFDLVTLSFYASVSLSANGDTKSGRKIE